MVYKSLIRPQSFLGKPRTSCEVSFFFFFFLPPMWFKMWSLTSCKLLFFLESDSRSQIGGGQPAPCDNQTLFLARASGSGTRLLLEWPLYYLSWILITSIGSRQSTSTYKPRQLAVYTRCQIVIGFNSHPEVGYVNPHSEVGYGLQSRLARVYTDPDKFNPDWDPG